MKIQEQSLQLVLDNLPALVAFLNTDQHYEFANRMHFSWFGITPEALEGKHISEVIGTDAYDLLKPHYDEALTGRTSTFMGEIPYIYGGKRFIHGTAVPLAPNGNKVVGILALASDLTEFKLIERALDATTLRSQTVLDTAVDGIITIDESGIIQSCNASVEKIFGYPSEELIGQNIKILMPSSFANQHDGYLQRYMNSGEKRIIGIGREVTGKRKDGSEFPMELSVGEFIENGRHYFTGFTRDITDRKMAEWDARARLNELSHVTRLSTIHNLASGLAHEINQPLTAIVTMAQALLRTQRNSSRIDPAMLESTLEKIVKQSVRASTIIQQMREYVGKEKTEGKSLHSIEVIIRDVLQLLEHEIGQHNIRVFIRFDGDDTLININRIQIEQVVLNLVKNAIEAMTGNTTDRNLIIKIRGPQNDFPFIQVSIEDNGCGLPEEYERVFESFYTTKAKGMGQGLSICRSIVESHGGTINAVPNSEQGTVFLFELPIDQAPTP